MQVWVHIQVHCGYGYTCGYTCMCGYGYTCRYGYMCGAFEETGKQPKVSASPQGPSTFIWNRVSHQPGALLVQELPGSSSLLPPISRAEIKV